MREVAVYTAPGAASAPCNASPSPTRTQTFAVTLAAEFAHFFVDQRHSVVRDLRAGGRSALRRRERTRHRTVLTGSRRSGRTLRRTGGRRLVVAVGGSRLGVSGGTAEETEGESITPDAPAP
jgi:hypothetical protein